MSLWIKCRQASELASRALDERLPFSRRVALKLHRLVCANCTRFAKQLDEIRRLLHGEQAAVKLDAGLSPEARHRIASELQKKLDT